MTLTVDGGTIKVKNDRDKQLIPFGDQLLEQLAVTFACVGLTKLVVTWHIH